MNKANASKRAVILRIVIALPGGYVISALVACCLALWLPLEPADAVAVGQMASFSVFALAVLISFAVRDLGRLTTGATASALLLSGGVAITLWMRLP